MKSAGEFKVTIDPRTGRPVQQQPGTGALAGSFVNPSVTASSYDTFRGFGYKDVVCVPKPLGDGCVYQHTYGVSIDWEFKAVGPVTYAYSVPFQFDWPTVEVAPGQRVHLEPRFTWGNASSQPTVTATMDFASSQSTSVWADAPFDGMDDLRTSFTQYVDHANISVGIPVLPLAPSISGNWNAAFDPFSTGGGAWGGSYTRLGSAGRSVTSGSYLSSVNPSALCVGLDQPSTSAALWKMGHEQFELAGFVLQKIPNPATVAAGSAILTARDIGGFRLNTQLDGSITRYDYICLELSEKPYFDVPRDLAPGGRWDFRDLPVHVKYRVYGVTTFLFNFGYDVTFDMKMMDPRQIAHGDFLVIQAGGAMSPWQEQSGTFTLTGYLPVATSASAPQVQAGTVRAPSQQRILRREPAGVKIASIQQTRPVTEVKRAVPFPKPTALRGAPQGAEYTVVLGSAAATKAEEIVALLKRKGISAFVVTGAGSTELVVTLGAFLDRTQAEQMAGMFREILRIDGDVVQSIQGVKARTIGDDVIRKLGTTR